jgi:hypothetical protein
MKEIQNKGELKSQAGLPYDPTVTGKNEKGEPYTFVHTKEDKKYQKYFSDLEQWETFISLPLTEPQRNKLMSKLQGEFAKVAQLQKEEEKKKEEKESKVEHEVLEKLMEKNLSEFESTCAQAKQEKMSYAEVVKNNLTQK